MLLSVGYGGYILFLSSPKQTTALSDGNEQKALKAFITKIAEKTTTGLSKSQAYALQKAEKKWERDPFVHIEPKMPEVEEESPQPVITTKKKYTGFLEMGDKRLAIIDGMEYEAGDILEPGGYTIRSISPSRVVIALPGKKKETMTLPMEESE